MTTSYCRHSPSLSREGNVSHAFICEAFLHYYLVYKKAFRLPPCNSHGLAILEPRSSIMLSFIQTKWNQLSTIWQADGPPFSPERSYVLPAFLRSQVGISWTDVCWSLNFIMAGRCHSTGIAGVWILRIASFIKKVRSNILPWFPWIHIVDSTFHQPPAKTGLSIVWKSTIS